MLLDEHAVSIGVEPVAFSDRVLVGAQDVFFAGERAYQHQQSGLRKVEICEQGIDHFEFEPRINKNVGRSCSGKYGSSAAKECMFESADGRSANSDDAARSVKSLIDGRGGGRRN